MTVYRPTLVRQADGSYDQWVNCTPASGAMALDRQTLGKDKTTGAHLRQCSGILGHIGLTINEVSASMSKCYSQPVTSRWAISWATFVAAIKSGRGAILSGGYGGFGAYRCQLNFSGNHAIYVNELLPNGNFFVYDPLCTAPKEIPSRFLEAFAGDLRLNNGGTIGQGWVYCGLTKITAAPKPTPTPTPTPTPAPKPVGVTLRFGGVASDRGTRRVSVAAANQRRSPFVRSDNLVRSVPRGTLFHNSQTTTKGTNVGGSSTWFGDGTGTVWMHSSVLTLV